MPLLRGGHCPGQTLFAVQDGHRLPVAQRVQRLHRPIALQQPARLLDQPGFEHRRRPPVEPVIEAFARRERAPRRIQANSQQAEAGERVARQHVVAQHRRERFARCQADFDGANQLGGIVRVDALGGGRIEPPEHPVQPTLPVPLAAPEQTRPQLILPLRPCKQAFGERAQVEPRPAGHNRQPAATGNLPQNFPRLSAVLARGKRLVRVRHVYEVVRQLRPLLFCRFSCTQIHSAIHGH